MKHKIGDRVRIITDEGGHGFDIGEIVEITAIDGDLYDAKRIVPHERFISDSNCTSID